MSLSTDEWSEWRWYEGGMRGEGASLLADWQQNVPESLCRVHGNRCAQPQEDALMQQHKLGLNTREP